MADFKVQGIDDLKKVLKKVKKWESPKSLDLFLRLIRAVIEGSKYKDWFLKDPEAYNILKRVLVMKAKRVKMQPDLEEVLDVATYAFMIFTIMLKKAKIPLGEIEK